MPNQSPEMPAHSKVAELAFPPGWYNPETQPTGAAYLAQAAKQAGFAPDVTDANRDYMTVIAQSDSLAETLDRVQARLAAMNAEAAPNPSEYAGIVALAATPPLAVATDSLTAYGTWLREREQERGMCIGHRYANSRFDDTAGRTYVGLPGRFIGAMCELDIGSVLSGRRDTAATLPDRLAIMRSATDVAAATPETSVFDRYVLERFLPHVEATNPLLVGISLNAYAQVKFGLRLAAHVREAFPGLGIVLGGNQTHFARPIFEAASWLGKIVDGLVVHEGETALVECLRRADEPSTWGQVPNVRVYRDSQLQPVPRTIQTKPEIIPLYTEKNSLLDKPLPYASERRAAVLSRGCYWAGTGRDGSTREGCLFCTHHITFGQDYRRPEIGFPMQAVEDLYASGVRQLHFVDETLPPNILRDISEGIIEKGLNDLVWGSYIRFERAYTDKARIERMYQAGCRLLEIGLESASPRVLNAMDKGINIQHVREALAHMLDAGIKPNLFIMFGFPTETREEAEETLAFMEEWAARGVEFSPGVFDLTLDSPALKHHKKLGIELLVPEDQFDTDPLIEGRHYRRNTGITTDEAVGFYRRALAITRAADNLKPLQLDSLVVQNAFVGMAPVAHPDVLASPEAATNNPFNAVNMDVFGAAQAGDVGSGAPQQLAVEPMNQNNEQVLVRVLGDSFLTTQQIASFIHAFSTATTPESAIADYCNTRGLNPGVHGDQLYALMEQLITHNILVVH